MKVKILVKLERKVGYNYGEGAPGSNDVVALDHGRHYMGFSVC